MIAGKFRIGHLAWISVGIILTHAILFPSCSRFEAERLILVKTQSVQEITAATCLATGFLMDLGESGDVDDYGFALAQSPDKMEDFKLFGGFGTTERGAYTSALWDLDPNTTYYIWAFASKGDNTAYGEMRSFTTLPPGAPIVSTVYINKITSTTAYSGGWVQSAEGSAVTAQGVCWNTSANPTTDHLSVNTSIESPYFEEVQLTGLDPGTIYYVRAFATNSVGTGYGDQYSFTTLSDTGGIDLATLSTQPVGQVTSTSAHSGGLISSDGGSEITSRGVCWNTAPGPTTANDITSDGSGLGEYGSDLTGLTPNTKYYLRAYAVNSAGTAYGDEVSFTTEPVSDPPQVITVTVEEVAWSAATVTGNVTDPGGSPVSERGICWSTTADPTISGSHFSDAGGVGEFSLILGDLIPDTHYYTRAYAINSGGIAYGNTLEFNTLPLPVAPAVVTGDVTVIEATGITVSNSYIEDDGGAPIATKGLCWNTEPNPTILNSFIEYGAGFGTFTMEIAGLNPDTEYYIRAFATNDGDQTGYGEEKVARTLFQCGMVLQDPRDLKEYSTIQIGEQCWMGQNLNTGVFIDTSNIFSNNMMIEKKCYDNDPNNCDQFGGMYSWDEMMQFSEQEMGQGVCPDGWHVPSDGEWMTLEMALGMTLASIDSTGWRGYNNEGGKLKSTDPVWDGANLGATNESQFTALPSGMVWSTGQSVGKGEYAVFWTSTSTSGEAALYRYLHTDETRVFRTEGFRPNTTPVRCIKD